MTQSSAPGLLVLHAVRLLGFAGTQAVARRFALDPALTDEQLLDAQAYGWVTYARFADLGGWSLTERGRTRDEAMLADELDRCGGRDVVLAAHARFLPLNARLRRACTDWQLRPAPDRPLAPNDHTDPAWDARVLGELAVVEAGLAPVTDALEGVLVRFDGYGGRFAAARRRAAAGDGRWVDGTDVDSCHRVWFELHEDLVATLGIDRSATA